MADTLEATGLFDVVFVLVLNILLDRADGYDATGTQLRAGAYDATGVARSAVGFFANPSRCRCPRRRSLEVSMSRQTFGIIGRVTERARLKEPRSGTATETKGRACAT